MCKVIEKFAEKIFFGRNLYNYGANPEIYHLYVYCCMYFKSLYFTVVNWSPVPFLTVLATARRETRPLQFIWVIFIIVKCAFSIAEQADPKPRP